jgi:hypothetical protein
MSNGELAGYAATGWPDRQAWYYWQEELPGAAGNLAYLLVLGAATGAIGAAGALLWPPVRRRPATTATTSEAST